MDTTAAGLQLSLGRLFEWCRLNHIDMHLDKSKVVVFHPDRVPSSEAGRQFYFGTPDKLLERVPLVRYLGVWFHERGGWKHHIDMMVKKGVAALAVYRRRLRQLPALDLQTRFHLYDATVAPVYLYGSELWAGTNCGALERLHRHFLLSCMGVTRHVSTEALLCELGRFSVLFEARCRQLSFYIRLRHRRAGILAEKAFAVAQHAYRSTPSFRRMEGDNTYFYMQKHNTFTLFARTFDFMGQRVRISQIGPLSAIDAKHMVTAHTKAEFARILTERWNRARLPDMRNTPSLPPPLSLSAEAISLLPWRTSTCGQTARRALFLARKELFVPSSLFNHAFSVAFPRLHRSFPSPLRDCPCDMDSIVCMAPYVPAAAYMHVVQQGQDWLHRLIQPLPCFPSYLSLPFRKRRVLFLFRVGCYPSAIMDGRILGRPREGSVCPFCSHRTDLLVSAVSLTGQSIIRPPIEDESHIFASCPLYRSLRETLHTVIGEHGVAAPDASSYRRWRRSHPIVFTCCVLQSDKLPVLSVAADFLLSAQATRTEWLALNPFLPDSQTEAGDDLLYEQHVLDQWALDAELSD